MTRSDRKQFVSRAGEKLDFALEYFKIDVKNKVCADLGSSTGGFVDCLLQRGVSKIYSVDTCYGELDWNLRNNTKIVVMERTNALNLQLPELVDLVTIDTGWTKQELIIPKACQIAKNGADIISLLKPQYEVERRWGNTKIPPEQSKDVLKNVLNKIEEFDVKIMDFVESPITGRRKGNVEYLVWMKNM